MTVQLLAWVGTVLGWTGAWAVGNRVRAGWLIALASAASWLLVDVLLGLVAGVVATVIAAVIATRNWVRQ